MASNFNVDPYYDDFDPTKNFHRILFKPGFAVQARELTQSQTILQDQITKFADNIFKQNSPVTGGQVTTNLSCDYIKLQPTDGNGAAIDVNVFAGRLVQNATGTVVARVLLAIGATTSSTGGGDPDTLIVTYKTGTKFTDGDIIYDSLSPNTTAQALSASATGSSSVVSIAQGVFYISGNYTRDDGIVISNGNFVQVNPQTTILSKYSNTPNVRVGLNITETIYDYINDPSLLDPAIGASNYQAPGADRYVINLTLETRPLTLGDDGGFIQLVRVENGNVFKMVDGSVYNVIDDYFAKRDYETNGDYVVQDFKLTPKTYGTVANSKYIMSVGKGLAYVHGYRVENPSPIDILSNRARTTESQSNNPVFIDNGSYLYVDTMRGANSQSFFYTGSYKSAQPIDIHCVSVANVNFSAANAYTSTVVASGYLKSVIYDYNTNDLDANTSVFKTYLNDLQNGAVSANVVSATASTIVGPSYLSAANGAYVGVALSIKTGTSAGDFRVVTAYDGSTKTLTVNQNWTVTPDTTSVFNLSFGIKDSETLVYAGKTALPYTSYGTAVVSVQNKAGNIVSGDVSLQNPINPEMVFTLGNPYVSALSDTSYTTTLVNQPGTGAVVSFTVSSGTLTGQLDYTTYGGTIVPIVSTVGTLDNNTIKQNYTIIVINKGSNTKINNGDILNWTSSANTSRSVTVSGTTNAKVVNFQTATTDLVAFTGTIIHKATARTADNPSVLRTKQIVNANTTHVLTSNVSGGTLVETNTYVDSVLGGQVYIRKAGLVSPGNKQYLYLVDVKNIVKIYDTGSPANIPTVGVAIPTSYTDVTSRYNFNNGQRDSYYDHAYITLKSGAQQPAGNILILVNRYNHTAGGYFSIESYSSETYTEIPSYLAVGGRVYSLRDSIDFRPSRDNASNTFTYGTNQVLLPVDNTTFLGDYTYYLSRKDKLVVTKDKSIQIVEGSPSLNPILPTEPEGSLVIANLIHDPYTGYLPTEAPSGTIGNLSIDKVKHKRFTMQDIAGLENRINQVEYYTALNSLEVNAQSLQTPDTYGLNRFKNGILVDDFSSFSASDTGTNSGFSATINKRTRQMTASQNVKNFPLKPLATVYGLGKLDTASKSNLGYKINRDGEINYITLPYTTANLAVQRIASRAVNINPFSFPNSEGVLTISPNTDVWVDTEYAPALLIIDPGMQVFQQGGTNNVLQTGDWQTVGGTTASTTSSSKATSVSSGDTWRNTTTTTTSTTNTTKTTLQNQNNIIGPYNPINNTYALNNGYITDISILPYIRPQEVVLRAGGLLMNTGVYSFFDGRSVDRYIRKPNIIELTSVTGLFEEGDTIGYVSAGTFRPTGRIIGIYNYADSTKLRLYVAADGSSTTYNLGTSLQTSSFNTATNAFSPTADGSGTILATDHYAGSVRNVTGNTIQISALSSSSNNYYGVTGNTLYITSGRGVGQTATITQFNAVTKTLSLSSALTCANGDIYSITKTSSPILTSTEDGSVYGIFSIPPNVFHNGERVLRLDNSISGDPTTATTFAEGTFYAEGLSTNAQQIDFGASPSGARGTFTRTENRSIVNTTQRVSVSSVTVRERWDPVAQSFIIDGENYPNGAFISSVNFFFRTKPGSTSSDKSPVTLSILGTQNGYPNGVTLDHSIVVKKWIDIKTSETPHYLDSSTYTTFTFSVPIYIQPNVLYAFMLKSASNEYTFWTAASGDTAVPASVKNLPTDATPQTTTKISSAPYVGGLFISQNAQTWTADQNQSLMFTADRCVFNITGTPTVPFVVPNKLPQRALIDQSVDYFLDANSITLATSTTSKVNALIDALNITTTDFTPTTTGVSYSYAATLASGGAAPTVGITPGKFGTSSYDNLYLSDGLGQRVLLANSNNSLSVYTTLTSGDAAVSPVISDAGLSAYAIKWNINNCELSNTLITLSNGGSGYNVSCTTVTVVGGSADGASDTANISTVAANISDGVIQSIYFTSGGSGYITTPTLIIADSNTTPGSGASAFISGETSKSGGPALVKYVTKKVVLDAGYDSGDLNVFLTAYRPVKTDILVYYKILNRNDTQNFDDSSWQLMTMVRNGASVYSQTRNDIYEYTFAPGLSGSEYGYVQYTSENGQTYYEFSQFAIKVVLTSSDATYTPFLNDIRCLALPGTVNTAF
jgi:hypothetical protein